MNLDDLVSTSAALLRQRLGARQPRIAVLLGSGWGPLAEQVQDAVSVAYSDLPAFPVLAIGGHAGVLKAGRLGAQEVIVLAGRKHPYETGAADGMKGVIRTLAALGVQVLVQTNAAGSMDAALPPGSVMLIEDHLNVVQMSPLVGEKGDSRFVDMGAAYCPALRAQAQAAAVAATGKTSEEAYLKSLGAHSLMDRAELSAAGKPLQKERWAGVVDAVGSHTLANALAQTRYGGAVAACGLAQGFDLPSTVMPFILRSVHLIGVDSVMALLALRQQAWARLAQDLDMAKLESMIEEVDLDHAAEKAHALMAGQVRGRVVVRI